MFLIVSFLVFACFASEQPSADSQNYPAHWTPAHCVATVGALYPDIKLQYTQEDTNTFIEWSGSGHRKRYPRPAQIGGMLSYIRTLQDKNAAASDIESWKQIAIGQYKIHLMPQDSQSGYEALTNILREIAVNQKLRQALSSIKCKSGFIPETYKKRIVAPIILYAADGRANAQKVLVHIYDMLKYWPGPKDEKQPSFNIKITDMIFYAQGDGDARTAVKDPRYFFDRHQNYALYSIEFTNSLTDYSLKHPDEYVCPS